MIRYRTGIDAETGKVLRGLAHLNQSIGKIVTTIVGERVMRLSFGAGLEREIGRNLSAVRILALYGKVIVAVHRWEPEARITQLRLVTIDRTGALGLGFVGSYFPEGRFGNFDVVEPMDINVALLSANAGTA